MRTSATSATTGDNLGHHDHPDSSTPRLFWPEIHPGRFVQWRETPSDYWSRVFVACVIHEHDGDKVYTLVMVALLDERGQRMGSRTVNGAAIETCIRPL